jgi:hypothetical protein
MAWPVPVRSARSRSVEHLATRLARLPGVVAVTLGGSRAAGTARPDSDWDFGLYYRGTIDPADVEALGWPGQVFAPGEWGWIVNGGAWLTVDGERIDLIYRDLDQVLRWTADAERGAFEIQREVGYVAGIATYVVMGELALGRVLAGELPRPGFPEPLRMSAPPLWFRVASGALHFADVHAHRGDAVACLANTTQAVLATAQGRVAAAGQWALNEKRIVAQAGLEEADGLVAGFRGDLEDLTTSMRAVLCLPDAPLPA